MARESGEWRQWLDRHGPALLLVARQWAGTAADAEDAVQEGFVRFWRARERARNAGYLYACVRSAAIDLARCRRRRGRASAGPDGPDGRGLDPPALAPPQPAGPMRRAELEELTAAVEVALTRLPPEQREVVVMKVWGGLTFAEIAGAVGINANTAASRYRYALGRLEAELAGFPDGAGGSALAAPPGTSGLSAWSHPPEALRQSGRAGEPGRSGEPGGSGESKEVSRD